MENIFLEWDMSVVISTPIVRRIRASQLCGRWSEAHDLVDGRAPSDLCMCPLYSVEVIDRCACSGSSCLNSFYDMLMTRLWKGEILENLPVKRSGAKKRLFENIPHLRIISLWDLFNCGSFDFLIIFTIIENIIPQHDRTGPSKAIIFEYFGCATFHSSTCDNEASFGYNGLRPFSRASFSPQY